MEMSIKIKTAFHWMKYNKEKVAIIFYCIVSLMMVLSSVIVYSEPVVPVCILLLMETAIIALLNKSPIWLHGIFIVIQLVAGILMERTALTVLLTVCYLTGFFALYFVNNADKKGKK